MSGSSPRPLVSNSLIISVKDCDNGWRMDWRQETIQTFGKALLTRMIWYDIFIYTKSSADFLDLLLGVDTHLNWNRQTFEEMEIALQSLRTCLTSFLNAGLDLKFLWFPQSEAFFIFKPQFCAAAKIWYMKLRIQHIFSKLTRPNILMRSDFSWNL